jgi:hypothetical protein
MDTPTTHPFSDSGAINPIPEGAQALSLGRYEEFPDPSGEPMTTGDPVIDTLAKLPRFGKVTQLAMLTPQGESRLLQ